MARRISIYLALLSTLLLSAHADSNNDYDFKSIEKEKTSYNFFAFFVDLSEFDLALKIENIGKKPLFFSDPNNSIFSSYWELEFYNGNKKIIKTINPNIWINNRIYILIDNKPIWMLINLKKELANHITNNINKKIKIKYDASLHPDLKKWDFNTRLEIDFLLCAKQSYCSDFRNDASLRKRILVDLYECLSVITNREIYNLYKEHIEIYGRWLSYMNKIEEDNYIQSIKENIDRIEKLEFFNDEDLERVLSQIQNIINLKS